MASFDNLQLDQPRDGVYCLTIARPKVLNALNPQTLEELAGALDVVESDSAARVLLITGAGEKAFVAGADISRMRHMDGLAAKAFAMRAMSIFRRLELMDIPVIALVNGFALGGGCELMMSCDFALASDNAKLGQPEVALGVTAGFGGTQRLTRIVGKPMALEMLVTGRMLDAAEAQQRGLVNHVYPRADLMQRGLDLADKIIANGPVAVNFSKELVQRGQDMDLENACAMESDLFGLCFSTDQQSEGMQAFLDKRKAVF
ncbi:MAG: enoyl-CoA hydratase-related protein [Pseudomonadales bacterium]